MSTHNIGFYEDTCISQIIPQLSSNMHLIFSPVYLHHRIINSSLLLKHTEEMSLVMRKPALCICQNKGAGQLRINHAAEQRLCFHYITDSKTPLLPKSEISNL